MILSSVDSRRVTDLLDSSWSSDGSFSNAPSYVTAENVSSITSDFQTSITYTVAAKLDDDGSLTKNYVLAEFPENDTSMVSEKSLRINMPP